MAEKKQVFTIEMQSVKPQYTGTITDSISGETLTFRSAGEQINFIVKHSITVSSVKIMPEIKTAE
ncbi:MAG TPA: hypothetical protein PLM75_07225 [bacterium]|nr:hypothetical protein [bacterium]